MEGIKEKFSWSTDVIAKMIRELAEKIENRRRIKNRLYLFNQVNDLALLATASSGLRSKRASPKKEVFFGVFEAITDMN